MCGIAGILNSKIDLKEEKQKNILEKISESLKSRGPDGHGEYTEHHAALLHRRLAIVDPENGRQPMRFGPYIICYNGEIYNTAELKKELEDAGQTFETHSDTEIVLKACAVWQEAALDKLNGIFAFGVYNTETKTLLAARDKMGVKPFYYSTSGGGLSFASRVPTMLLMPFVRPVVDEDGLNEIFMLGPASTPGKTVFKDIAELPPGHFLKYRDGELSIFPYWQLKAAEHKEEPDETIEHTHFLLTDAIRRQMISDVPICAFLSGGLDSSVICAVMQSEMKKRGETLHTFSVDYVDNDKYFQKSLFQPNKDSDYIGQMADYIGSRHKNIVLKNEDVASALKDSVLAKGYPAFADVDSSLLLFCREVKKEFKVCLSGECADEIFGGYPWYHNDAILFEDTFPWSRSTDVRRQILKNGLLPHGDAYARARYEETLAMTDSLPGDTPREKRMREMFVLNLQWFMQTLLMRKDVMSMESSLEVRVPFCDCRLVEYAYNMPWEMKSLFGREKGIVRKAFENELPYDIAWRKKSPYPKTHNPIFFQAVCRLAEEAIGDRETPLIDLIDPAPVHALMQDANAIQDPWYGQLMRGPQILAYIYQIYVFFKNYNVEITGVL